jgi:hypothetical protein
MKKNTLLRDFLIVNGVAGFSVLVMFAVLLLQKLGVFFSLPCGLLTLFHIYCPGCGGTRALFSLLSGHPLQSLYYNPAVLLGAVLALYYETAVIVTLVKNNGKVYYYQKPTLVYIYVVVIFGYTVVRDILLVGYGIDMLGNVL